jgi:tetratricopeptide (TPR) repeat protein
VFWASAVGDGSDSRTAALHALERKSFLRRQKRSSIEGELEYAFAHALVRDVAYGQIARADRATRHRRVAEWIEALGRPDDHAEMRAYHWRSALELTRASGSVDEELVDNARVALRDAGDRAYALSSFATAAARYDEALSLWPADDSNRPELLFSRSRALFHAYEEERREEALEEARDALLAGGDEVRAGEAEAFLANVAWERGDGPQVRAHLARAEELVGDSVSASAARVLATSARMFALADEPKAALQVGESAFAMADRLGLDELRAHSLATVGMAKNDFDPGSGIADMERALALALDADSPIAAAIVNNLAVNAIIEGDLVRADELYTEALQVAERFGNRSFIRFVRGNLIWSDFMQGRWDQALEHADAFVAECESGSPHALESNVREIRATIREARDEESGALEDRTRALELARGRGDPGGLVAALSLSATAAAERGRLEESRALASEVIPMVRDFGAHGALVRLGVFAEQLGVVDDLRAALAHGAGASARLWRQAIDLVLADELAAAADAVAGMGSPALEAFLRRHAGERLIADGRRDAGDVELERALAFYRSVEATHFIAQIEGELAGSQRDSA